MCGNISFYDFVDTKVGVYKIVRIEVAKWRKARVDKTYYVQRWSRAYRYIKKRKKGEKKRGRKKNQLRKYTIFQIFLMCKCRWAPRNKRKARKGHDCGKGWWPCI
jgi:hypothetical protein